MQAASMLRTPGLVSSSRYSVSRAVFQKSSAPLVLRQRYSTTTRAEADNTGGSITNSGKTSKPDSYQVQYSVWLCMHMYVYKHICLSRVSRSIFHVTHEPGCLSASASMCTLCISCVDIAPCFTRKYLVCVYVPYVCVYT